MSFVVAPIVEGHGDVPSVRILLERTSPLLIVARPVRWPRSRLIFRDNLVRATQIAASNIRQRGGVLLMIDADDDCPATMGPELQRQMESAVPPHVMCRVAMPVREFESWIVGGDLQYADEDPDAGGALKSRIAGVRGVYKETVDQPKLIAAADLDRLRRVSPSFRHFSKVAAELAAAAAAAAATGS